MHRQLWDWTADVGDYNCRVRRRGKVPRGTTESVRGEGLETQLIELLRCPVTRRPLAEADAPLLQRLNEAIDDGSLLDRLGQPVRHRLDDALVDAQREYAVAVVDGIPDLIPDDLIPLAQLNKLRND